MTRKQRRFAVIAGAVGVVAVAVLLVLFTMKDAIVFFNSPTDIVARHVGPGTRIRLGGLVAPGSVSRGEALAVRFDVTDGNNTIPVTYQGVLPDLFREGQGVVAEGALDGAGVFKADNVLAKHDETYMPKDVADALKRQGHWKDEYGSKRSSAAQ
jgi:cytochrome c-type biogenesis protein CcmE